MPSPVSFENSPMEYSITNHSNPLDIEFTLHCMVGFTSIQLFNFLKTKPPPAEAGGFGLAAEAA